jgi:hypothetical protein
VLVIIWRRTLSGGVPDGSDDQADVALVEAGDGVAEVHGVPGGYARRMVHAR